MSPPCPCLSARRARALRSISFGTLFILALILSACSSGRHIAAIPPTATNMKTLRRPMYSSPAPGTRAVGGQITAIISSTEFQLSVTGCASLDVYYNQSGVTTQFDPANATLAVNYYVQVTGIQASACAVVTSAMYITVDTSAPVPTVQPSGMITSEGSDGTFTLTSGPPTWSVSNTIVQNGAEQLSGSEPRTGEGANIVGYGLPGTNHFVHATSVTNDSGNLATYAPSYIYQGVSSASAGTGGNDCNNSPCSTKLNGDAGVQFIETLVSDPSQFNPDNAEGCQGAGAVSCESVFYTSFFALQCTNSAAEQSIYNELVSLEGTGGDTGFLHTPGNTTPYTSSERLQRSGSCANSHGYFSNPASPYLVSAVQNAWFPLIGTDDATYADNAFINGGPPNGTNASYTEEYGNTTPTSVQNYRHDIGIFFNSIGCCRFFVINALGPGGGAYPANQCGQHTVPAPCSSGSVNTGIVNYQVDVADICKAIQSSQNPIEVWGFERMFGSQFGSTLEFEGLYNIPIAINTVAYLYNNAAACEPVQLPVRVVDLEQPYNGSGGDFMPARQMALAVRLLLTPNDNRYGDGQSPSFLNWEYVYNANQTAVYPEYGLIMTNQTPSIGAWNGAQATWGDGCYGGGGGAASLVLSCGIGVDSAGYSAGVFSRSGLCWVFTKFKGNCTVLLNDTTSAHTISNSWCAADCSTLHYAASYSGSGPQEYYNDDPSNPDGGPCPAGNGCMSLYAATPAPTILNACEHAPSTWLTQCSVVLMQNP